MSDLTVHPFGDEWLYDEGGDDPMQFADVESAAAYANDWRKDMRKGAQDDNQREFFEGAWFSIEDVDGMVALVGPDGSTFASAEALDISERIGESGEWPDEAARDRPHLWMMAPPLLLVDHSKVDVVKRVREFFEAHADDLAAAGIDANFFALDHVECDEAAYDPDADYYRSPERKAALMRHVAAAGNDGSHVASRHPASAQPSTGAV